MSQSNYNRRRVGGGGTPNAKETTNEDQALNMIAREAEARLAAKRAARAEARSIRMKEIERKQNEYDEEENLDEEAYLKVEKKVTHIPIYDVPDMPQIANDSQILQLKEVIRDGEVKYKKAMVNAAQLDNERQALQYQVEILKDIIEELQQRIENTDDELLHKSKEYNMLNREFTNTSGELNKCLFLLKERERVLDENGINLDGSVQENFEPLGSSLLCNNCHASQKDDLADSSGLNQLCHDYAVTILPDDEKNDGFEIIHDSIQVDCAGNFEDNPSMKSGPSEVYSNNALKMSHNFKNKNIQDDSVVRNRSIENYARMEYFSYVSSSSGSEPSSININKYLFNDHNDTLNEESEQLGGFSVDRYFATDSMSSANSSITDNRYLMKSEDCSESRTSIDTLTNVHCDYDSVDPMDDFVIQDLDNSLNEISDNTYDDYDKELVKKSKKDDILTMSDERNFERNVCVDIHKTLEMSELLHGKSNVDFCLNTLDKTGDEVKDKLEKKIKNIPDKQVPSILSNSLEISGVVNNKTIIVYPTNNKVSIGCKISEIYSDDTITNNTDLIDTHAEICCNVLVGTSQEAISHNEQDLKQIKSMSEDDKRAIRKDLEDLYNQIAEETNEPLTTYIEGIDDHNTTKIIRGEDKKEWLVQVESFPAPISAVPEIEIGDSELAEKMNPEPKERKKKKKKKQTKEDIVVQVVDMSESVSVPSDPFLLGFTTDSDVADNLDKPIDQSCINKSDIPKQFLDASAELIDSNYSDISDNEDEGEDGRKKSMKRSKKEGCKSQ